VVNINETRFHSLLGDKVKENIERKRCTDGHENQDFDTTTASMLKAFLRLKRLWWEVLPSTL